jgi:HAD superfamily hydrolase (TIGR01484 family)
MKHHDIKLIVCDIEGCIMPSNRALISPQRFVPLVEYCNQAQANSDLPPLVFCTGRQVPYAEALAQMINNFFPGFPSITENGAFLYDIAKNAFYRHPILTNEIMNGLFEVKKAVDTLVSHNKAKKELGKEVCISLNPFDDKSVEDLFDEVCHFLTPFSELIEITHSKSAVDITPKGVNKASGVRFLSEFMDLGLNEMLGIGDTRGDLPMLRIVGTATAPQNATDEVKKEVSFVAHQNEIEGVMEILHNFIEF